MADSSNVDSPHRSETGEVSLYAPLRVMLENRYLVVVAALAVALLSIVPALIGPRSYTATGAFMPEGNSGSNSGLAAVAGQLGLTVRQSDPTQSPQFYAEISTSRELLGRLLTDTFSVRADSDAHVATLEGSLADLLRVTGDEPEHRREQALRSVSRMINVSTTATGMVRLAVTSSWPELSEVLAARLIELINEFNLESRQSNAAAESRFVQERLEEARASLRRTEEDLGTFLEANRQFEGSPQLLFEYDRLQRQLQHQQQLYTGLQEAYESARITQVRDTPVLTVVETPERPVYPDSRRIPLRGLLGLLVGGFLGILVAFLRDFIAKGPDGQDPEYERLQDAWLETLADLRIASRIPRRAPRKTASGAPSHDKPADA